MTKDELESRKQEARNKAERSTNYQSEKRFIKETVLTFVTFQIMALENMLRETGYYLELLGPLSRCRHDIQQMLNISQKQKGNQNE